MLQVRHVWVGGEAEPCSGCLWARVEVDSWTEARRALAAMHRARLGAKRLLVSVDSRTPSPHLDQMR